MIVTVNKTSLRFVWFPCTVLYWTNVFGSRLSLENPGFLNWTYPLTGPEAAPYVLPGSLNSRVSGSTGLLPVKLSHGAGDQLVVRGYRPETFQRIHRHECCSRFSHRFLQFLFIGWMDVCFVAVSSTKLFGKFTKEEINWCRLQSHLKTSSVCSR